MRRLIAAIDQGTTSTRCILFDHSAEIVACAQREHQQIYPAPGWVEHDPLEIWDNTCRVIEEALAQVPDATIVSIGITNQRETTLVWDRHTGEPLYNAIVWMDTRTRDIVQQMRQSALQEFCRERTGLPIATYFSATKLLWLLENVEGLRDSAENGDVLFGTIDSWLIWKLTGTHVTDVTNASRTLLINIQTLDWDEGLLEAFDVPHAMLPTIVPSSHTTAYGTTATDGPFGSAIPICGVLGDQQSAMVGQTCFEPGSAKNTYGTGCFLLLNTGTTPRRSKHGLLTTVAYQFGDNAPVYALEGSVAIAGALVQWLRDNLRMIDSAAEIETLAWEVEDSAGIYFVPAFSGLFAPYWRDDARGVIVGLTGMVNRSHIARAALEAVAFQSRELVESMEQDAGIELKSLKVDGGMVVNDLLMQMQSDMLGVDVIRPKITETTALGAAYAAGLASGFWSTLEEVRAKWQKQSAWSPQLARVEANESYKGWLKAVRVAADFVL